MGEGFRRASAFPYDSTTEEKTTTASASVRLRRTTFEYAFVSVPMDELIWEQHPDDPKKRRVNTERVMEIAKRMGAIRLCFVREKANH